MGVANAFAAYRAGVVVIDASCAGLGGCPFAPGAKGNVATEDIVWMLHGMGVSTGVNLDHLINLPNRITTLPGALIGGRVRAALAASIVGGNPAIQPVLVIPADPPDVPSRRHIFGLEVSSSRIAARAAAALAGFLPTRIKAAPFLAKPSAVSKPMPLVPPVTAAILSVESMRGSFGARLSSI